MQAWLIALAKKVGLWLLQQLWKIVLDHVVAFVLAWKQKRTDTKNAEEYKETFGADKDQAERDKRAEDLLNGN